MRGRVSEGGARAMLEKEEKGGGRKGEWQRGSAHFKPSVAGGGQRRGVPALAPRGKRGRWAPGVMSAPDSAVGMAAARQRGRGTVGKGATVADRRTPATVPVFEFPKPVK
jgi:hypothetical protein